VTRLFLDANVLFTAAHNPHGKASLVLELAAQGHWQALTSTYAAAEARRNVAHKFPDCSERLEQILADIETVGSGRAAICPLPLRDKDKPIFEAALLAGATHLLTGDIRDFGPFMNAAARTQPLIRRKPG
jgi:predicted nucleic acid-binding protein